MSSHSFSQTSPLLFISFRFVYFVNLGCGWFFYRISSKQIPRLMVADVLVVVAFQSTKEWLLDFDVGVFWVVMRVLACGGLGVLVWEVGTQQVAKRKDIEVIVSSSFALFSLGSLDLGTVSLRPLTPSPLAQKMIDEYFFSLL